eukprot:gnl/Dysnectes_brevis/3366_a4237_479.p1 GENE.gnl/Dysnectes_brevis/3366_a4237_479~~gnl/Dysnectes_brevis/3366_a4237_479.p1  ORF type:complete len:532 (-),score=126.87 gnl/Dysnectes_brevis/3366_a4237_479:114-1709(-)
MDLAFTDLQNARQHALEGKYEPAKVYFDGFLSALNKYLYTVKNADDRAKWKHVKSQLKAEFSIVNQILDELHALGKRPQPQTRNSPEVPSFDAMPPRDMGHHTPSRALPAHRPEVRVQRVARRQPAKRQPARREPVRQQPRGQPMRPRTGRQGAGAGGESYTPSRDRRLSVKKEYERPWRQNPYGPESPPRGQGRDDPRGGRRGDDRGERDPSALDRQPEPDYGGLDARFITAMTDAMVKVPEVSWSDVAGLEEAKRLLKEAVILPHLLPDFFSAPSRKPWSGVLMFGPPGTGKTLLAKATAAQSGTTFFNVSASTIESRYRGESEKMVRALFVVARAHAPSTVFIDEIDALVSSRGDGQENEASRRVKSEFLTQMQGAGSSSTEPGKGVMVLAATNLPWDLDQAMRRRLEKRIYIPLPDEAGRLTLLKSNFKGIPISDDIQFEDLAARLEGYSGADISIIVRDAVMTPLRRAIAGLSPEEIRELNQDETFKKGLVVTPADIDSSLTKIRPSVSPDDIEKHVLWMAKYGSL